MAIRTHIFGVPVPPSPALPPRGEGRSNGPAPLPSTQRGEGAGGWGYLWVTHRLKGGATDAASGGEVSRRLSAAPPAKRPIAARRARLLLAAATASRSWTVQVGRQPDVHQPEQRPGDHAVGGQRLADGPVKRHVAEHLAEPVQAKRHQPQQHVEHHRRGRRRRTP